MFGRSRAHYAICNPRPRRHARLHPHPHSIPPIAPSSPQVLISTFGELISKGFCTASADKDKDGEGGQGGLDDDVEGTGMGSGTGKKDVSEELEEEGQLDCEDAAHPEEEAARGKEHSKDEKKEERAKEDEVRHATIHTSRHTPAA